MRVKEKFNKKLLVEGNDDRHVIWALCERFNVAETFDVIDCEGIDNLTAQIPVRLKESEIETIGIVIDADTELNNRWKSLTHLLSTQGYELPATLPSEGLVLSTVNKVNVGVWIMPNNNSNGMLEDFISFLVPKDDTLLPIVRTTLQNIEDRKLNKYSINHKSKAVIHSWLAYQEDPGTPMGLAITKRYLTTNEETCLHLIKWLNRLYND